MHGVLLAMALLSQQPETLYRFRTLEHAANEPVWLQAEAPPSPANASLPGNPFGFTRWLNETRAMHGLRPVTYDADLSRWASQNNQAQRANGKVDHYVLGPSRLQCAAIITGDIGEYVGAGWMGSDEHRGALLDPNITQFGIAWDGAYWTLNVR